MTDENFAARLKELRRRRGLTQEELAERSKLAPDTIRRLEYASFNPSLGTLKKLADGFGITTLALLDDNFDKIDELAMFIRALPEPHQRIAFAVVLTLQHDVLLSSS